MVRWCRTVRGPIALMCVVHPVYDNTMAPRTEAVMRTRRRLAQTSRKSEGQKQQRHERVHFPGARFHET